MSQDSERKVKYENARIVSARTLQIAKGAPLNTKPGKLTSSYEIAKKEASEKKIPLKVK